MGPHGLRGLLQLCTHLGCPVGLYEQELQLLVCPCHQSMFNVMNGAVPQFGPAPRPLPQLPLYIDSEGLHSFARRLQPARWTWILGALMSDVATPTNKRAHATGARSLRQGRQGTW